MYALRDFHLLKLLCPYSASSQYGGHCWGFAEVENGRYELRPKFHALLATETIAQPAPPIAEPVPAGPH